MQTNELNYSSGYQTESTFKEIQATLNPPLNINQTSGADARFVIPAGVYNWSKSHIDLDIVIANAGNATLDALHLGRNMLVNSINLTYDGASQALVNIQNCRVISCMTLPQLKFSDFQTRPVHMQNITNNANVLERGEIYAPIKHSSLVQYAVGGGVATSIGNTYADLSGVGGYAVEIDQTANGALAVPGPLFGDTAPATAIGKLGPTQATCYVKLRINLSDFKNTLFAQNKTIYYPVNATLTINFAQYNQWGFSITGTASPSLVGSADLANTVSLAYGPILWIAYENTEKIIKNCQLITNEGLTMRMPYVSVLPAGGSVSTGAMNATNQVLNRYNLPLSQTYGNNILRIYTVVCRTDAGVARLSNCNNVNTNNGILINNLYGSVRSYMGQYDLQQGTLNCANGEDFRYLRNMLEGSAITNQTVFQNFSFWVDNFTNSGPSWKWDEQNSDFGGYSMINDLGMPKNEVYAVDLQMNFGACAVYFIVVGQRNLYVKPGVVSCDAI